MITERLRALAGVNTTLRLTWVNGYSAVGSILYTERGYAILRDGDDRPRSIRPEQIESIELLAGPAARHTRRATKQRVVEGARGLASTG